MACSLPFLLPLCYSLSFWGCPESSLIIRVQPAMCQMRSAALCTISSQESVHSSGCVAHMRKRSKCDAENSQPNSGAGFLHRFWRPPICPRLKSQLKSVQPTCSRITAPCPLYPSELKKYPAAASALQTPGFRTQCLAISVTALVLSVFHPHQSAVLNICSVPFLPPKLTWERKWTAERMCSLDWDLKQPFRSAYMLSVTSEQQ